MLGDCYAAAVVEHLSKKQLLTSSSSAIQVSCIKMVCLFPYFIHLSNKIKIFNYIDNVFIFNAVLICRFCHLQKCVLQCFLEL